MELSNLNPPQRQAVLTTDGPLLVLAGAGSGKTRVLTHRIAYLLEKGVPAWSILAITFTNKAAKEMKERILKLSGDAANEAWISTFHASCARILRRDIEKLGYSRSFTIYDDDDQMSVIREVAKSLDLNDKMYPAREIKSKISDAKNKLLTPMEWLKEAGGDYRAIKIAEAYKLYDKKLKANNALDFDDLLVKTLELFANHPPVLEGYQRKFSYILVDEYQDTNQAQYMMIKLLAGEKHNICVVGDDDQSIYGWRGADIRNILGFEEDFNDTVVIKLEQNYRSTSNILDAANNVIAHNAGRKEKALWSDKHEGDKIFLYAAADEREEAAWVVNNITKLRNSGKSLSNIAILYRINALSRALEEVLVRGGIPYRVYGGQKFYERKEIKDIVAYLRAIINPADDVSLRRIINEPKRAIGDTTISALMTHAANNDDSLFGVLLEPAGVGLNNRALTSMTKFAELMMELIAMKEELPPKDFLPFLLDKTGYVEQYKREDTEENQNRLENINEFIAGYNEFMNQNPEGGEGSSGGSIEGFLENVALVTDLDSLQEDSKAVTLMTLHSAKGLEYKAVFLVGVEEGIFPITRAMDSPEQLEEERRLMYVGITRAMDNLYISYAKTRMMFGGRQSSMRSRFIDEIPRRLLQDGASSNREHSNLVRPNRDTSPINVRPQSAALGITGVQKGFGNVVESKARALEATTSIYSVGDIVRHKTLGNGTVIETKGSGKDARLVIEFPSHGIKEFIAALAPVIKVGG